MADKPTSVSQPSEGSGGAGQGAASEGSAEPAEPRRGFIRRHLALTSLAVILLVIAGFGGGFAWWANHQIGEIPRIDAGIPDDEEGNESGKPLDILLIGADHGDVGLSVAEDLADGDWTPGLHLSDTLIWLHIPADRKSAQLVSIPRDSWVKIRGYPSPDGYAKINAAFSWGGPKLAVRTVQNLTGANFDHLAIIDWAGFRDLTSAIDGVRVYVPETFTDPSQHYTWTKGWHDLEGEDALKYVRTRYGLSEGDFGRIHRQQNFLRALMGKLLSSSTTQNPVRFARVLGSLSSYLTIDKYWDNGEIRSLAWSLRNLGTQDVQFVTAPFGRFDTSADGQSIVRLDKRQSRQLFTAVRDDDLDSYLEAHPDARLANEKSIN